MRWQPTIWTAVLVATAVVSLGLSAYVLVRHFDRDRALAGAFVGLSGSAGVWALAYAFQLSATALSDKLLWNQFVWIGAAGMLVAWPVFVLAYTGHDRWTRGIRLALLAAVPTAIVIAVWAGEATRLLYLEPSVATIDGVVLLTFEPGGVLLAAVGYTYAINLATYGLLATTIVRRTGPIRRQATILLFAGVLPIAAGVVGNLGVITSEFLDLTPVAFVVTTPVVAWAVFRYRLLELSPIARDVLFGELSDGVVVTDDEGIVVDANDAARSWFGDRLVGRPIEAIVGAALHEESGATRRTIETETGVRVFDVSVSALTRRRIDGTVLLFRDVTDRESLERRYRALIEKSPNVIATLDADWRIEYVGPSVERILGYRPATLLDRSFLSYVHPEDRDDLRGRAPFDRDGGHAPSDRDEREGVPSEGGPIEAPDEDSSVRVTHRFRAADDRWREFETTIRPLFDGEFVVTATDVTERQRYEQRLQVLNRVLRHDLNNDMNVVIGYADLLEAHVEPEGVDYLETIRSRARRLLDLSERARTIDIALDTGSEIEVVDIRQTVAMAIDRLEGVYPDATIRFEEPPPTFVRAHQLHGSAIDNVLENAIEHNDRSEPTVELSIEQRDDRVELRVADDGPGVPPGEREVLESGEETALEHASGLGLWLVNWIVSESGGELAFEENEPRGSVVRLSFPRAAPEAPPDEAETVGQT